MGTARAMPTSPLSATPAFISSQRRETTAGPSRSLACSDAVPMSGPVLGFSGLSLISTTELSPGRTWSGCGGDRVGIPLRVQIRNNVGYILRGNAFLLDVRLMDIRSAGNNDAAENVVADQR